MDLLFLHSKGGYGLPFVTKGRTILPDVATPLCVGWLMGTIGFECLKQFKEVLQTVTNSKIHLTYENIRSLVNNQQTVRAIHIYTATSASAATQQHMRNLFPTISDNEIGYFWEFVPKSDSATENSLSLDQREHQRNKQSNFLRNIRIIKTTSALEMNYEIVEGGGKTIRHYILELRSRHQSQNAFYNIFDSEDTTLFITCSEVMDVALRTVEIYISVF